MKDQVKPLFRFFLKIILPSLLAVLLFVITLFWIVIPRVENAIMDRKREMIQELTNSASSILAKYHKDELEGILSREEAQQTAISRIQYLRYGDENKDYFWITDMHPTMIMHPYIPDLNGKDLTNYEDSHGKKLFVEFAEVVNRDGQGFVDYMWQWKDDSTHIVPKLSYVKGFEPWGWIIGTGIYIEDVKKEISALSRRLMIISIIIALVVALILTFISTQSLRIERRRQKAELDLEVSREKYRSLVEASTEGLLMVSEGKIIFANSVFLDMLDIDNEQLMLFELQQVIRIPEQITQKLVVNQSEINESPFETSVLLPNAKISDVLVSMTSMNFYGRDAVILSIRDISTDKMIRRELFESRERYKTLMDKLNVGIFRTTTDARGRLIEANSTAMNLLGFSDTELYEDVFILDLFVEEDDKKHFRQQLFVTGFIKNRVMKLKRKDGTMMFATVSLALIHNDNGKPVFCDGTVEQFIPGKSQPDSIRKELSVEEIKKALYVSSIKPIINTYVSLSYNASIQNASHAMNELQSPCVFVTNPEGAVMGVVSEKEFLACISAGQCISEKHIFEIMRAPVPFVNENAAVFEAIYMMQKHSTEVLLVKSDDGMPIGAVSLLQLFRAGDTTPFSQLDAVDKAMTVDEIARIRVEFVKELAALAGNGLNFELILRLHSVMSDAITQKLIQMAQGKFGKAPCEFSFIVLGSEGRQEQTFKTDQDNALIYEDIEENKEEVAAYFLRFGTWICESLDKIGYSFCKGEVMAMNPKWNQPLSVWKKYFKQWINTGHAKDLLDISIFFDFRLVDGKQEFVDELQTALNLLTNSNPAYLFHLAQNTLSQKYHIGFGDYSKGENAVSGKAVHLKECIAIIVSYIRIYSLQQQLSQRNTILRLNALLKRDVFSDKSAAEIKRVYSFLLDLRIKHQSSLIDSDSEPTNIIPVSTLTDVDQAILKTVFSAMSSMLSKLSYDFKGSM